MESSSHPNDPHTSERVRMVRDQIERRGIADPAVLDAMRSVPRHAFVPEPLRWRAYDDVPLPIGEGQTISQPYIVAFMSEAIRSTDESRVLEVGTGSGYQTAVLSRLARHVYSLEVRPQLADTARARFAELAIHNVTVRVGDGHEGWPEEAPYDAILVTAAPADAPQALLDQLAVGGRLVIPVGTSDQELVRITRHDGGFDRETLLPVRFVPLTRGLDGEDREP